MQSTTINPVPTQQERLSLFRPGLMKILEYRGMGGGGGGVCLNQVVTKKMSSIFAIQSVQKSGVGHKSLTIFSPKCCAPQSPV